jgi:hypothetical protein
MSSDAPIRFDDSSDDDYSDDDHVIVSERERLKQIEEDRRLAEMLARMWEEDDRLERERMRRLEELTNEILDTRSDSSSNATPVTDDSSSTESQDEAGPVPLPPPLPPPSPPPPPVQIYDCGICFDKFIRSPEDKAGAPDVTLFGAPLPCSHAYCDDCLRDHIWTKLRSSESHIVRCPDPDCNQLITTEVAERVLRYDQIGEWDKRQILATIEEKVSHNL